MGKSVQLAQCCPSMLTRDQAVVPTLLFYFIFISTWPLQFFIWYYYDNMYICITATVASAAER